MMHYKRGNDAAFAVVYDSLERRLFSYLRRQTREDAHAEDLMQHTFLKIHTYRATFIDGARVAPWAFQIARRILIDAYRRNGNGAAVDAAIDPQSIVDALPSGPESDPHENYRTKEGAARANAVLFALTPREREAWILVRIDGFSNDEVAEMLGPGTTEMSVRMRVNRADRRIRAAIHGNEGNDDGDEE